MSLSAREESLIRKGQEALGDRAAADETNRAYYEGSQRLAHIGLAVPPELRKFELVVNWPRVTVDTIEQRQDVKSILVPSDDALADRLRVVWDANNMESELPLFNRDKLVYGRSFLSVGTNEESREHPLIRVESPTQVTVKVDPYKQKIDYAVRLAPLDASGMPTMATLYTPMETVVARYSAGRWVEVDRDVHNVGRVPIFPSFNRRMTGEWFGRTEMADIIPITDAAARTMTNLQVAVESVGVPKRWIFGVKPTDFVKKDGSSQTEWESYLYSVWANPNKDVKAGQFPSADLSNFHDTVELYGKLAASLTGFPARYFGLNTTNPPAEGAIRAEESQLVKTTERKNSEAGATLGAALAFAGKIATGKSVHSGLVNLRWHDPATPTFSQRADALQKLAGGIPIISREGAWDELGWDDARKKQEQHYFDEQVRIPGLEALNMKVSAYE